VGIFTGDLTFAFAPRRLLALFPSRSLTEEGWKMARRCAEGREKPRESEKEREKEREREKRRARADRTERGKKLAGN